jgi:hypothetical protein
MLPGNRRERDRLSATDVWVQCRGVRSMSGNQYRFRSFLNPSQAAGLPLEECSYARCEEERIGVRMGLRYARALGVEDFEPGSR